jgi:hypothetical protein
MKTLRLIAITTALLACTGAFARGGGGGHSSGSHGSSYGPSSAHGSGYSSGYVNPNSHSVSGYVRRDGIYVAPSHATNPNGTRQDNYTHRGNVNPYTGQVGTRD